MDIRRCLELFGVGPEAGADQIGRVHRDLAAILHPDRHGAHEGRRRLAEEKLKEINAAYDILKARLDAGLPLSPTPEAPAAPSPAAKPAPAQTGKPGEGLAWGIVRRVLWWASAGLALAAALAYWPMVREKVRQATAVYEGQAPKPAEPPKAPERPAPPPVAPLPEPQPAPARRHVLIYLTDGTVIRTTAFWEKEGMLMYRKAGGVIGIEKAKVARIEKPAP